MPENIVEESRLFRFCRGVHLILSVGGGFAGLCSVLQAAAGAKEAAWLLYAIFAFFTLLYGFGIFAGLRLVSRPAKPLALVFFYLLQIPVITSPQFCYMFGSGFSLNLGYLGQKVGLSFALGSNWMLTIYQMQPWGVALNLFAMVMLLILLSVPQARVKLAGRQISSPAGEDPY